MHLNKFYIFKLLTNGAKNFWLFFFFFFGKLEKINYKKRLPKFQKAKIKEAKI